MQDKFETALDMRGRLDTLQARCKYLAGGKATFTLVGRDNRFTYRVSRFDREGKEPLYFVSVLVGPDNWTNYRYAGVLDFVSLTVRETAKSKIQMNAPSMVAFSWFLKHLDSSLVEFWHEGSCCVCGRKLTVPESIASGIGPVCAGK